MRLDPLMCRTVSLLAFGLLLLPRFDFFLVLRYS